MVGSLKLVSEMSSTKLVVGASATVFNFTSMAMSVQKSSLDDVSNSDVFATVATDFPSGGLEIGDEDEIAISVSTVDAFLKVFFYKIM